MSPEPREEELAPDEEIAEVLQRRAQPPGTGSLLTGWAVVTEWIDADGETRWLAKGHAAGTTPWAATGMFCEAIMGDWPETW